MSDYSAFVNVKALGVTDVGNGVYRIELPSKPLTLEQHEMLVAIFPNLVDAAYKLLDKELLLFALASDEEVTRSPVKPVAEAKATKKSIPTY